MGALAHYLESEGIPTTQISLIREHTEIIRPPRALWVPFDLGRPLGVPGDADFQRRVLVAALNLLERSSGPVLEDFPDEAPAVDSSAEPEAWACPVSFAHDEATKGDGESPLDFLQREIRELRPWYDLGLERKERTSVAYFTPEDACRFLGGLLHGETPPLPEGLSSTAVALRLAAQDLKAFYFEAVASKPGHRAPNGQQFNKWFWQQTAAGEVLKRIKELCADSPDKEMRFAAKLFLVPVDQA